MPNRNYFIDHCLCDKVFHQYDEITNNSTAEDMLCYRNRKCIEHFRGLNNVTQRCISRFGAQHVDYQNYLTDTTAYEKLDNFLYFA